jgi:hypothetical protein
MSRLAVFAASLVLMMLALVWVVRERSVTPRISQNDSPVRPGGLSATTGAASEQETAQQVHLERTVGEVSPTQVAKSGADVALVSAAARVLDPDQVVLPTIDGRALTDEQSNLLRILAHAMSEAGLSCEMPSDISSEGWDLLHGWIAPLRAERKVVAEQSQAAASREFRSRIDSGRYEVRLAPPSKVPREDVVGWQHAKDAQGKDVVYFVRIPPGQVPELDFARARTSALDRDMALLARGFFDRFTK